MMHDERRARVDLGLSIGVEMGDDVQVILQRFWYCWVVFQRLQQLENAVWGLAAGFGKVAVQSVQAGAGVGVDQGQSRIFVHQVFERCHQGDVFEHIGMVAGMKGVAITEHGAMVTISFASL